MTKTLTIENGQRPTEEQLQEIEEAQKYPIVFDEDCPELSPVMMKAFKSAIIQRNRKKKANYRKDKIDVQKKSYTFDDVFNWYRADWVFG